MTCVHGPIAYLEALHLFAVFASFAVKYLG
jgi:hypothetical protein